MMKQGESRKDTTWGILGFLMGIFLFSCAVLISQQKDLNNVTADFNEIEYLSSSTQRLVRMVLTGQSDRKLLYYLDDQTTQLMGDGSQHALSVLVHEDFKEMSDLVIYNWWAVKDLISAEELDSNTLLLAADNHFYQMTNLSYAVSDYAEELNNKVKDTQLFMVIVLLVICIMIVNNYITHHAELKEKREQAKLALIDSATGLYNRSKCQEIFKTTHNVQQEKHTAIIVFDLNDLKKTNDQQGHRMGDELIRSFASLLKTASEVHLIPPFIGRYGGDEFIVYYENIQCNEGAVGVSSPSDELEVFLKELSLLTKDFNDKERRFQVSYAQGSAISSEYDENGVALLTVRKLFDLADEAMYVNKKEIKDMKSQQEENVVVLEAVDGVQVESYLIDDEIEDFDISSVKSAPVKELTHNERLKATNRRNSVVIVALLSLIALYTGISTAIEEANKGYIGGNVLHLPTGDGVELLEFQTVGNPWNNASFASMLAFRSLFVPDNDFVEVYPDLASGYEVLDNGLTYVITLKEGEKWSDGTPITMDDLVFSFESFLLCENVNVNLSTAFHKIIGASEWKSGKADSLEGLEVNGNELTIRLSAQHNTFPQMLAQFVPLPQHILGDTDPFTFTSGLEYFYNPVCSGMYMVEGMDDEHNLIMVKNPYYTEKQSDIDKLIFHWDYFNEELDYYPTSNITQMVSYRSMKGMDEYFVDVYFYRYFVFNLEGGYETKTLEQIADEVENPADIVALTENYVADPNRGTNTGMEDVRVRQAIIHAIDCEQLLRDLYFNTGTLTYGGSPNLSNVQVYEYNPSKAIELLEEAEYDFDRPLTIAYYHSDTTTYVFLQQVKEYLEAVGFTVDLVKSTGSSLLYDMRPYDMMLKGLSSFNTEDWYNEFLSTNSNMSALLGDKGEFDDLVYTLSSTSNSSTYLKTLQELVDLEQSLVYKIPLFTLNESVYINDNRVFVPEDIIFSNTRYRSDLRFDEWYVKKG